MEVLLDTNFIISCVKKKIDFISQLEEQGFRIVLPREVYQELKDVRVKSIQADREVIDIALKIIESRKIKKIGIGSGKVDEQLIKKGKQGVYIASLDAAIKRAVPNRVIISDAQNSILIQRD